MSMSWAPWTGASECTSGPTDGARALLAWALEAFPHTSSLGIYNCRSVRGGATTSLHGEGRAVDIGVPVVVGRGHDVGHDIVTTLGQHGRRLGVQCAIFAREIWSARSPNGRPYDGVAPHWNHVHVELTWPAASRLNLATLRAVTGTSTTTSEDDMALKKGDRGPAVALFMDALVREAELSDRSGPAARGMPDSQKDGGLYGYDGIFGSEMLAAVKAYQSGAGIDVTGELDGVTAALLTRYSKHHTADDAA